MSDIKRMKLYKVLGRGGVSCNGGNAQYSLPTKLANGRWKAGKWMPPIEGNLAPCQNGYHSCRKGDLVGWLNEEIYICEIGGTTITEDDKVVSSHIRLLSKCEGWNETTARLFAADCAEHVLPIFEKENPNDQRPHLAIRAARDFAGCKIKKEESAAARAAARAAAQAAAQAAARAAAGDAAWAAAWDAERKWQTSLLLKYLANRVDISIPRRNALSGCRSRGVDHEQAV